jgi:hypothetical protein
LFGLGAFYAAALIVGAAVRVLLILAGGALGMATALIFAGMLCIADAE